MDYFVTGGTGFIGRFLVGKLLDRGGSVHVLVREASLDRFEALRKRYPQTKVLVCADNDDWDVISVPLIGARSLRKRSPQAS